MYLERAEEEDKKTAESWKGDAEGILVFVSTHLLFCASFVDPNAADRSFLCHCRDNAFDLHLGPPAELSRHFSVLPGENLSATLQGRWIPGRHSPAVVQPCCFVHCTGLSCLGELALVLKFGD